MLTLLAAVALFVWVWPMAVTVMVSKESARTILIFIARVLALIVALWVIYRLVSGPGLQAQ